ncbi:hypothetical protein [Gordonia sp. KTR9]|uniref:hypothetical protein n=1 Tax=Gordonia sp. KTR9 TaxID=337191 RepID=UPI00027DDA14|nr:hypothetical protein [Gordonia sp. KTR9]AFR48022.1 hypothetical protein KTR9_1382 [Gordonia sp. KTR9]
MDWATFVSIIGALGVGSILTQHFASGRDRRQVRAEVLDRLEEVETKRWAGDGGVRLEDFIAAIHRFETAALIARIPREAVRQYIFYAFAANSRSRANVEDDRDDGFFDPDTSGGIDAEFADAVRDEANEIAGLVWTPLRSRLGLSKRLRTRHLAAVQHIPARSLQHAESAFGPLARA